MIAEEDTDPDFVPHGEDRETSLPKKSSNDEVDADGRSTILLKDKILKILLT